MNWMNREQKIRFMEAKIKEGWADKLIIDIMEVHAELTSTGRVSSINRDAVH